MQRVWDRSVERVHGMASRVNEEIVSQNRLVDQIDEDVGKTNSRLGSLQAQLRKLSRDSDSGKYCVILLLLGLLAFLILLVLS